MKTRFGCLFAWLLLFSLGAAPGQKLDFESIRHLANRGNVEAQFNLGAMYENAQGVPANYQEAVKWYSKAAAKGNAAAQYNLGLMYANGKGTPRNSTEAIKWFRKAAEQGDAQAQYNLGVMFDEGEGSANDKADAVSWFKKAAEQGLARSQYEMALIYANGRGVKPDPVEAYKWLNLASDQGYRLAVEDRDTLAKNMTPQQIATANLRAAEFVPKKTAPVDPRKKSRRRNSDEGK